MNVGKRILEHDYAWRKKNLRRYNFTLNKVTNKEIYEHLEMQVNKRDYLIKLIRKDINEKNQQQLEKDAQESRGNF